MRLKLKMMTLLCFVSGCVNGASHEAICDGTKASRREHAAAMAVDGGPRSLVTGALLIKQIDAACVR